MLTYRRARLHVESVTRPKTGLCGAGTGQRHGDITRIQGTGGGLGQQR
jgi:hypothetical protein